MNPNSKQAKFIIANRDKPYRVIKKLRIEKSILITKAQIASVKLNRLYNCPYCKSDFYGATEQTVYCSRPCSAKSRPTIKPNHELAEVFSRAWR